MTSEERRVWLDDLQRASSWLHTLHLMADGTMGAHSQTPAAIAGWALGYKRECDDRIKAVLAEAEGEMNKENA